MRTIEIFWTDLKMLCLKNYQFELSIKFADVKSRITNDEYLLIKEMLASCVPPFELPLLKYTLLIYSLSDEPLTGETYGVALSTEEKNRIVNLLMDFVIPDHDPVVIDKIIYLDKQQWRIYKKTFKRRKGKIFKKKAPVATKMVFQVSNEVLRSLAEGKVEAYHKIFDQYADRIGAVALHYLKSEQLAVDIVREVFSNIQKDHKKFKDGYVFDSYMMDLLVNLINSYKIRISEEQIKSDEARNSELDS